MKIIADAGRVISVGGHSHNARKSYALEFLPCSAVEIGLSLVGRETELGFFFSHVELQEAGNDAIGFQGLFVDLVEQSWRVGRMDKTDEGRNVFDFVRLQVADEMPFEGREVCWSF